MPAIWVTDPRVRWESIDESKATLIVPFGDLEEEFTVFFDPETHLIVRLESMRFKGEDDAEKTLWINEVLSWEEIDGRLLPARTALTWGDEDGPWAQLDTDSVVYSDDVSDYLYTNDE